MDVKSAKKSRYWSTTFPATAFCFALFFNLLELFVDVCECSFVSGCRKAKTLFRSSVTVLTSNYKVSYYFNSFAEWMFKSQKKSRYWNMTFPVTAFCYFFLFRFV